MSYLDKVIERRDAVKVEMDAILEAVAAENRTDLTEDETAKVDILVEESRTLDSKIEKLTVQAAADAKASEARSTVANFAMPKVGGATVTREARTYAPETDASFVKDAFTAKFSNDYAAQERLARHTREEEVERRSVGPGNFAGLVIPPYFVDLAAPLARAGRPTAVPVRAKVPSSQQSQFVRLRCPSCRAPKQALKAQEVPSHCTGRALGGG